MLCCCFRSYDSFCTWRESLHDLHKHCFLLKKSPRPAWKRAGETLSITEAPTGCQKPLERAPPKPAQKGSLGGCLWRVFFGGQKVCGPSVFGRPQEVPKVCGPRVSAFVFCGQKVCGPSALSTRNLAANICGPTFAFVVRPFWGPPNGCCQRLWSDLCGPSFRDRLSPTIILSWQRRVGDLQVQSMPPTLCWLEYREWSANLNFVNVTVSCCHASFSNRLRHAAETRIDKLLESTSTHVVGAWLILTHYSLGKFCMVLFLKVYQDGLFFKNSVF